MRVSVDRAGRRVDSALFGGIAPSTAIFRPGLGCSVVPAGTLAADLVVPAAGAASTVADAAQAWPVGEAVSPVPSVAALLAREDLAGPGLRALVVVKDGRIIAERYGEGFDARTPLLGWSMTKTVNAALIGILVRDGRMRLEEDHLLPQWSSDERATIRLRHLLAMDSGLVFNENYGAVADVTRMLYLQPDMASFAASLPMEARPGEQFNYASGTAVILSRLWMDRLNDAQAALAYPRDALFAPLGMTSAVMEADAAGTFAGSSYMYANARDWARFGLLLAQDGVWQARRLLPEGFVGQMSQPTASSGGRYSQMQTWMPKRTAQSLLPPDAFALQGHDGQSITVIPSRGLVVVRLGLTPFSAGYRSGPLVEQVLQIVP
jgi:CubicO group peptidase (beta-lactamase class C family)